MIGIWIHLPLMAKEACIWGTPPVLALCIAPDHVILLLVSYSPFLLRAMCNLTVPIAILHHPTRRTRFEIIGTFLALTAIGAHYNIVG